jgi:UPF0755 protein
MIMTRKKSAVKRTLVFTAVGLVTVALIAAWNIYERVLAPNVQLKNRVTDYIYIPTGADFSVVVDSIKSNDFLRDVESFVWVAGRMGYLDKVHPGKYLIRAGMNNKQLVTLLRAGKQEPVKVTFNNIRTIEQFAGRVSKLIEADSSSIVAVFKNDSLLKENNLNSYNSVSVLIPNTYEFYWNSSALQLYERMNKEFHKFWNESRMQKLKEDQLTQQEVITIASIIEQETHQDSEKPAVAGVYVNRFRQGWKLEADPTLIYALGDFTIRRVLNQHKEVDSPYNTYLHAGLPPGPICIPGIPSIDAVLNYARHDYFYFCAKDDFSGYHVFAKSYEDHLLNAKRFHRALTRRGIMS